MSLWHSSNVSEPPPARSYYTPKREKGNLAYRNTSKRKHLWTIGGSAAHSDFRTSNRSPCLSVQRRRRIGMQMFIEIFSSHLRNIAELRDVIIKGQCRLDIKKYSFSHRIINVWNILLTYCVNDSSVNMRKN